MITILYRDDDCVAVMKPAGVASVPERRDDNACLCAHLSRQLGQRVYPVHRLDKEVSGVILYALTAPAHRLLNSAFERREVQKTYLAVTHGAPAEDAGEINGPIHAFGSGRMGVDARRGKPSLTRFAVLQRGERFARVEAFPLTGRRHQIRVHLYSIGHPIAGDPCYGDAALRCGGHPRLMLTATGLALALPGGARLDLRDNVPDDFREAARDVYGLTG
ncbi:MAG: RluA family pseudouridine synthase [Kiritimatiellia bacterium]|jgi:RluA family pseudouridine synthase